VTTAASNVIQQQAATIKSDFLTSTLERTITPNFAGDLILADSHKAMSGAGKTSWSE